MPAWADGGAGGNGATGSGGGGGTGFAGAAGTDGTGTSAGGGGGAGGGSGGTGGAGAAGGAGGIPGNRNGAPGTSDFTNAGGGGGGGNGSSAATISNTSGTLAGGNGGAGGSSGTGGGGGGGAGGFGAIATTNGISGNSEGASILGGNGGNGGGTTVSGIGGGGGTGGVAVQLSGGSGTLFINSGTIVGGNGGTGGVGVGGTGAAGAGGVGIVGSGLTIGNFGAISGGLSGDGVTRANAITSTGGNNLLQIHPGSTITGNVVITGGGTNRLELSGGGTGTFDVSTIGAAAQYQGFNVFRKSTSETWILTGTTTAVTPWQINGGVLNVSADATLGAAGGISFAGGTLQYGAAFNSARAVTLNAGGGRIDTNGFDVSLGGNITGTGGLTKIGAGTLTLTGANSYSGGTAINGGTLAVSSNGFLGNVAAPLSFDGGTLQINAGFFSTNRVITLNAGGGTINTNGNGTTITSNITGTGGLTKAGAGILQLDAATTYSGTTTVSQGTLLVTGANILSGSSAFVVNTPGILSLGNNNQTIGSLAGSGIVRGGATLTAGGDNSSTTFSGMIQDGGGALALFKTGTGTMMLSGANTYTGGTTVNVGRLAVNGSLASGVTVNAGGELGGTGTITGNVLLGGNIAPGNSIGTLNITGTYTQSAGSTYTVEVNAGGQSDRINVTGNAILNGGTVNVQAATGGYARNTQYTILSASTGVTGTYAGVTSNLAFLTPRLSYDADDVFLTLSSTATAFQDAGLTPNQRAVGRVLDATNSGATGDFATVLAALYGLDTVQGPKALDAISGQPIANFGTFYVQTASATMNTVGGVMSGFHRGFGGNGQRVSMAPAATPGGACDFACEPDDAPRLGAWISGVGGTGSVLGDGNAGGFTYNFGGTAVGMDHAFTPDLRAGFGAGYTSGTQWVNGFQGRSNTDTFSGFLYASYSPNAFYLDALAGYAYASNRSTRFIVIPGLAPRMALGSTGANQFLGQTEAGYRLDVLPALAVTPFARLQGSTTAQNGFTETGADSLNLTVASQTTNSLRTTLGADISAQIARTKLGLRLGWEHEYADTGRPMTASVAGAPGQAFTVTGATPQRDSAVVGFSFETHVAEATKFYARYDGEFGGGSDNHALNVGLRLNW